MPRDAEKAREYVRTYAARHPDRLLAKSRAYRAAHREELAQKRREYYEAHRAEILARRRELKAQREDKTND